MGGKSYYCDYCDCFMKNDINVRNDHNVGTSHNIAKANYLQKFKDPEQILEEETYKTPCKNVSNNLECSFGFFCRFSHYSSLELAYLENMVKENRSKRESKKIRPLPWKTTNRRKQLPTSKTPSLQPIDFNKITNSCFESQWG